MAKQVILYLRVSTSRQAEKDLSIPDQRRQLTEFCEHRGWTIIAEYVEPGASATDDKRPEFLRMIDGVASGLLIADTVLVHSFSRFFRDAYKFEFYRRLLAKHSVEVVSITQELSDDPMGEMLRQIVNLFDEYQSKENAKHVLRAMKENARQGFWNGSKPPYGYRTIAVGVRADAVKKRLEIEPSEAKIVEEIFALCLQGNGIRSIADTLNSRGFRHRNGRRFNSSLVHQILTRSTYRGIHHFNKKSAKTKTKKESSEWVSLEVPTIIAPDTFDRVQALLNARRPTNTPPRIVNGPTLLTGLAKCGTCGGGMTLRTGKGGRYRYYTCNARATEGKGSCTGRNIPMDRLDNLVLTELQEQIFKRDRIEKMLNELLKRTGTKIDDLRRKEAELRKELRTIEEKIGRLYDALSEGVVTNSDGFKRTLGALEQQREELLRQVGTIGRQKDIPRGLLTPRNIDRFAQAARERLADGNPEFRKRYVRMFVDRIEVADEEIRIYGPKIALAQAISGGSKAPMGGVPSLDAGWWWKQSASNSSLVNSLINRENAGNFAGNMRKIEGAEATQRQESAISQPNSCRGKAAIIREFSEALQGTNLRLSAKLIT